MMPDNFAVELVVRFKLGMIVRTWFSLLGATLLLLLAGAPAAANQTPSSTAGVGPVTKTYPGTTTMQVSVSGANTVIFDDSIALNGLGGVTSAQLSPAISATTDAIELDVSPTGCVSATLRCSNRGVMTLTFSQPVTNPIIHISGLGANSGGTTLFHSSLVMTSWTAAAKPTFAVTNSNGNLSISGDEIRSTTINGQPSCTTTNKAGCGSVRMTGTITSVTFQIDMLMGGTGSATNVDGWNFTVSLDEDFGDAPASYDTTAAASHIVGGFYMGAGVTVENAAVTNLLATPITPSPIANASASLDGNDDGVTFPTLIRGISNGTIDIAVVGSAGRLQGWIDWAGDGSFATAGDQIATNITDGGSGDTDGLINGVIRVAVTPPAGATQTTTFARFRWSAANGVTATGRGTVGEVEDYQVTVYPQRADLALAKTISNSAPAWGDSISYTLTVTSATSPASTATATGITVQDTLPAGFSYTGFSGTGTYVSGTGVWTVGSLAPGASASITITGTVTATTGTVTNIAQITASSQADPDSTVNNGVTSEDDYSSVAFTVAASLPGPTCPAGGTNQTIANGNFTSGFGPYWTNWVASPIWTQTGFAAVSDDTTSGTLSQSGLTGLQFGPSATGGAVIQLTQWWRNGAPAASSNPATLTISLAGTDYARITTPAGAGTTATVAYLNGASGNLTTLTEFVSTGWRINIPTSVAATGALTFAHAPGGGTSDDFQINSVTLYTCTPGQLTVTKTSVLLSDGINATDPKAIPGATLEYCILVTNSGTVTGTSVTATDPLPSNTTYVPATITSGTTCANATTVEDDNNSGADETDPFGASVSGSTLTATGNTLSPGSAIAIKFRATIN